VSRELNIHFRFLHQQGRKAAIQKTTEQPDPLRQRLCYGGRGESKRQEHKRLSLQAGRISKVRRSIYGTSRWIGVDDPDGATALLPVLGTGIHPTDSHLCERYRYLLVRRYQLPSPGTIVAATLFRSGRPLETELAIAKRGTKLRRSKSNGNIDGRKEGSMSGSRRWMPVGKFATKGVQRGCGRCRERRATGNATNRTNLFEWGPKPGFVVIRDIRGCIGQRGKSSQGLGEQLEQVGTKAI
jgi:hypothetical protein